VPVGIS